MAGSLANRGCAWAGKRVVSLFVFDSYNAFGAFSVSSPFGSVAASPMSSVFLALGVHFSNNAVSLLLQSGDRFGISKGTLARLAGFELQAHIR